MAGHTIGAEFCDMLVNKHFINLPVTGSTHWRFERITGSGGIMAILTSQCMTIGPLLMFHQAVTSLLVRK